MKKMIFTAAMMLASAAAMAQSGTFQIKGNVEGLPDSLVAMIGRKTENIETKKKKFVYSKNFDKPQWVYLCDLKVIKSGVFQANRVFAIPGETIEMNGNFTEGVDIKGGKFYQEQDLMNEYKGQAHKDIKALWKWYSDNVNDSNRDSIEKVVDERMEPLQKKYAADLLAYAKQHSGQECIALLIDELDDVKDKETLISLMADNVKNGRMKAYYEPIFESAKKRAEMEEKAKVVQASGVEAPDFTLNDINGKPFSLSSLRGKYVVIDFWGSWCIWCIKGMPKMKEYYEKYKGKFEILGVDCNDTEAKWKAAVEKHQLPWIHVYNPKGSDVLDKYAIQGFPTKIVVGPDGKIVKTIVGEDPAFYTLLDEVLGK